MNFDTLYYQNQYTKEFDADLISCEQKEDHYETILSQTAFYPEGGGQPADHGTLNGVEVYDVQLEDGKEVHYTKEPVEGPSVHGAIDWKRRLDLMQQHTADHIFAGLVHDQYGYDNVGFQIGDVVRMDFDGKLTDEQVRELEIEANKVVWRDEPVEAQYPTPDELEVMDFRSKKALKGQVRIMNIPDVDVCACCGTHVSHTGEVGLIRILSCTKHKKGVRVLMLAGDRALNYDLAISDQNHEVSVLLSAEPQHTASAVKDLLDQNKKLQARIDEIKFSKLEKQIESIPEGQNISMLFADNLDRSMMSKLADEIIDNRHAKAAAIFAKNPKDTAYMIISSEVNLRDISKELNQKLNGRGGGRPDVIQGMVQADEETIRQTLEELFA